MTQQDMSEEDFHKLKVRVTARVGFHKGGTKQYAAFFVAPADFSAPALTLRIWGRINSTGQHKIDENSSPSSFDKLLVDLARSGYDMRAIGKMSALEMTIGSLKETHDHSLTDRQFNDIKLAFRRGLLVSSLQQQQDLQKQKEAEFLEEAARAQQLALESELQSNPNWGMF